MSSVRSSLRMSILTLPALVGLAPVGGCGAEGPSSEPVQSTSSALTLELGTVPVLVTLKYQPISQVEAIAEKHQGDLRVFREQVRAIQKDAIRRPAGSLDESDEKAEVSRRPPIPEDPRRRRKLALEQMDGTFRRLRTETAGTVASLAAKPRAEVEAVIRAVGGTVTGGSNVTNTLFARLPAWAVAQLAADPRVDSVEPDVTAELELDVSASTVGAPTFWNGGTDGGIWDVGLCDNGVDKDHPALMSHPFFGQENLEDADYHGTHVAGIIASTDPVHRGVAHGIDAIVSRRCSSKSGVMSGFDWMLNDAGQDADVGNISQGYGVAQEDDTGFSRYFDALVDGLGFLVAKSAGNKGNGGPSATITYPGNSYNVITVANMNDQGTLSRHDDRIASTSSQGPTAGGRKKPDLSAPGSSIRSTMPGGGWASRSGTSMAAPHVAGAIALLLDAGVSVPASAKAILINTADAWSHNGPVQGSAWNKVYGWGYLDLAEASYNADDYFEDSVGSVFSFNSRHGYEGVMYGHEKATLVWNRRAVASGANPPGLHHPHNIIYLYLRDKATNAIVDASTSTVDNVQQVACPPAYAGRVMRVEVVSGQYWINGGGDQKYSLATEENFVKAF